MYNRDGKYTRTTLDIKVALWKYIQERLVFEVHNDLKRSTTLYKSRQRPKPMAAEICTRTAITNIHKLQHNLYINKKLYTNTRSKLLTSL